MKKLIVLAICFCVYGADAKHFTPFGLTSEWGLSSFAYDFESAPNSSADVKFSMGIGVFHEFPILDQLTLRSEVLWDYYQGGGDHDFTATNYDSNGVKLNIDDFSGFFTDVLGGMSISPMLKYTPPAQVGNPYLEFGPKLMLLAYSRESLNYGKTMPDTVYQINESSKIRNLSNLYYALVLGGGADVTSGIYGTVTVGLRFTYWLKKPEYTHSISDFITQNDSATSSEPANYKVKFQTIAVRVLFAYKF